MRDGGPDSADSFRVRLAAEIQRLCQAGETARLRILHEDRLGMVVIEDGRLVHAQVLDTAGEAALEEIFTWEGAAWETLYGFRPAKRTITRPYQQVLRDLVQGTRMAVAAPPEIETAPPAAEAEAAPPPMQRPRRLLLAALGIAVAAVVVWFIGQLEKRRGAITRAVHWTARHVETRVTPPPETAAPPPSITRVVSTVFDDLGPEWMLLEAYHIWLPVFSTSAVSVLVSRDVFSALSGSGGWVELMGPFGARIGARAFAVRSPYRRTIYLRPSMAEALGISADGISRVALRAVRWPSSSPGMADVEFTFIRRLPESYCEHPLVAGLALATLLRYGLRPGMPLLAEGPAGYQSLRIQLMDRGNPAELWLSRLAREALGVTSRWTRVVLHIRPTAELYP